MEYHEQDDLTEIVERTAEIFEMEITHEAAEELSLRSRGDSSNYQPFAEAGARLPRLWGWLD